METKNNIKVEIEITNIDQWDVNWDDESETSEELSDLKWNIKMALFERCGLDLSNISIDLNLNKEQKLK
jgi:hypothetical protein